MAEDELLVVQDRGDGVWSLRLNRPAVRNALSIELRDRLSETVEVLAARPDVGALVLTGTGPVFCAGIDLAEFGPAGEDPHAHARLWASSDRFHHSLLRCRVPLLCALNGPALAGGFDLATLCDLRIGQPGVWFARPEITFAEPLFTTLRELIGGSLARDLCFTERRIEAGEALRIGLINRLAGADGAVDAALALARAIAARPRDAVRATKAKIVAATGLAARPTLAL